VKKAIIKYLILTFCGVALFLLAHEYANYTRGYAAIGGEGFFILLPVFWRLGMSTVRDIKTMFSEKGDKS
jgi:drug/metabolite transporter superfamily protein YnfA